MHNSPQLFILVISVNEEVKKMFVKCMVTTVNGFVKLTLTPLNYLRWFTMIFNTSFLINQY